MRLSPAPCWSLIALVAVIGLTARSIWSQRLRAEEFSRHANTAIEELLRRNRVDPDTVERVQKSFLDPGNHMLNKRQARSRLLDAMKQHDFSLVRDGNGFDALRSRSVDLDDPLTLQASGAFVDSVWSVIRRLSVLDQIGPHTSIEFDRDQLREYLKGTGKVSDYAQVTDSFHPSLKTEVVTFQQQTTLLRVYGGTANATGRYFFCCLLKMERLPNASRDTKIERVTFSSHWSDASGLATPQDNLLNHLAVATIPAGTVAIVGTVADNFLDKLGNAKRGGNTQIFVPEVKSFPFQEYRLNNTARSPVREIALQSDDRILRFRGTSQ